LCFSAVAAYDKCPRELAKSVRENNLKKLPLGQRKRGKFYSSRIMTEPFFSSESFHQLLLQTYYSRQLAKLPIKMPQEN
jgi:hypothetical protein